MLLSNILYYCSGYLQENVSKVLHSYLAYIFNITVNILLSSITVNIYCSVCYKDKLGH